MGQQVLTLGLSCAQGFVPIDSELFTGKTNVVALAAPFKDGRSIAALRHRAALKQTKPEMARAIELLGHSARVSMPSICWPMHGLAPSP